MTVLSNDCILALQAATAAACVEALNAAPPSELWRHVLAVVNPIIRAQAQKHMERLSCIASLPDELLLAIFECLPFWDRVRTATVCQRWRSVSLGAVSALWSDIPSLSNVDTYDPLLARARGVPLSVTYKPEELDDLEVFCFAISRNIRRLSSLRLILPAPYDDQELLDAAQQLEGVLCGNAPILKSLVIIDPGEIFGRVYDSMDILKSRMLGAIELGGFNLSFLKPCVDSPAVNVLRVSTPDKYSAITPEDWSPLSRLPALDTLSLDLPDVFNAAHGSPLSQSLQHLYLRAHPCVVRALDRIEDLSRFQTLHITFLHLDAELRRVAELLPSLGDTTVSAAVHFGGSYFCLLALDGCGRKRVFRNVRLGEGWHTLCPNVTTLWLDTCPASAEFQMEKAPFHALEELTLDVTPPVNAPPLWPSLSAPRLRVVRVISEIARPALPALDTVERLRHAIGLCGPLERLVFDRVALDSDTDNVDLAAIAHDVAMVRSGEVPRESYRVWANLWESRSDF